MFLKKGTYILKEFNKIFLFGIYIKVYLKKFIYKKKILVFIIEKYYEYKFYYLNDLLNNFIIILCKNKKIM